MKKTWTKSSFSSNGDCVEVRESPAGYSIWIRDTNDPEETISATRSSWDAFIKGVKAGEFD